MTDDPPRAELTEDEIAKIPPGYRRIAKFLHSHPGLRAPSFITVAVWLALLIGGGVYAITISRANEAVARVHNISACTLRSYLSGVRVRQIQTADDPTQSKSARQRSEEAIKGIDTLLSSQVTTPEHFNCDKLLKSLAQHRPQVHTK